MTTSELWRVVKDSIPYSCYCSDVYIPVNSETQKLISRYEHKQSVTQFRSQIDGKLWYDIPFLRLDDYIANKRATSHTSLEAQKCP